jgi:pyruvate dehydrogenase E2 component (dihydrolipoamide acetyltransferase)
MSEFRMPSLGADMEAGTLVEWLRKPGDAVKRGDIVAVVETEKGAIEIEIFQEGVIDRLLVEPGIKVPVGTPLAMVRLPPEAAAPAVAVPAPSVPLPSPVTMPATPTPRLPQQAPSAGTGRMRVSPAAAARAASLGVDVRSLKGTGAGGAITLADVEGAALAKPPVPKPPAGKATEAAAGMRHAIATAMARSKREIPHYYLGASIDMGRALEWLEAANRARPVPQRLLYGALLLKAVALALRQVPDLNGSWIDGAFRAGAGVHVGWAISLRSGGLIAPAIHDADRKSLDELMAALRDLVKRARSGGLRSSELSDPTITVTNLGEQGVDGVYGVIFPPQVALVGFGKIVRRPWCVGEAIVARPVIQASLSADHRASDGHRGGLFLATVDGLLQEPAKL